MANNNQSKQNVSNKTLDIYEWLEYSLKSTNEIERLLALEDLDYQGLTEKYLDIVRFISKNDQSDKCKQLSCRLLKKLEIKSKLNQKIKNFTPNEFLDLLNDDQEIISEVAVVFLRKSLDIEIVNSWREHLIKESNPFIISIGIEILSRARFKDDLKLVENLCNKYFDNSYVCKATLNYFSNNLKDNLASEISRFLAHQDIDVRIFAVRKLRLIDQPEAILYIKSLLYSKDAILRLKALRELILFDFELSSDLYLQHLAIEPIPYLLVLSGSAITFNPNPDFPPKIYDIILSTTNELKKNILQSIIYQLLYSINASKVLNEPIKDYLEHLKQTLLERKKKAQIKIAVYNLQSEDTNLRFEAINLLSDYLKNETIKNLLLKHLKNETDNEIKAYLENLLEIKPNSLSQLVDTNIKTNTTIESESKTKFTYNLSELYELLKSQKFFELQTSEQNKFFNLITKTQDLEFIKDYFEIIIEKLQSKSVLINFFEKVYKLGTTYTINSSIFTKLLNNSDPSTLAHCIKILAKFDIDQLSLYLPKLIQHEDIRVKRAVLEVYQIYDKNSALQHIRGMLLSSSVSTKKTAISLLATIDYTLVEPIIIEYIHREKNMALLLQAAYIIAYNPSINGLYELKKIAFSRDGKIIPEFEEVWNYALEAAIPYLAPSKEELLSKVEDKAKQVESQKSEHSAEKKSYQFKKVTANYNKNLFSEKDSQAIIQEPTFQKNYLERIKQISIISIIKFAQDHKLGLVLGIILITMIVFYKMGLDSEQIITTIGLKEEPKKVAGLNMEDNAGKEIPSPISGTKKNASPLLSGKGYAKIMQKAEEERERIRKEFEAENKKAFQNVLHEMLNYPEYRHYAEFYMNENCANAHQALEENNITEAHQYFLKALFDPNLSAEAKMIACQGLMFTSFEIGDFESLYKALDTFISTLPESDIPKEYNRTALKHAFDEMAKVKDINPEMFREKLKTLAQQNQVPLSNTDIESFIESFKNFQKKYCK